MEHFWWSWERSLEKWPKCKNEQHHSVLAAFLGLGVCGWRLLGSILGDLGHKLGSLGRSWRQVWSFLARCCEKVGRTWPKIANLSGKRERPMRASVAAGGARPPWDSLRKDLKRIWTGLATGFKHARLTATRGRRIEDACGEYRRPLSFQLALFGQPPLEVHGERLDLKAKIQQKSDQEA